MFCKIRSKLFDLYYSIADYNKLILCTSLRQLIKGVTKTDILCAVIEHNAHVERICKHVSNSTKVEKKQNKKYITYLVLQH